MEAMMAAEYLKCVNMMEVRYSLVQAEIEACTAKYIETLDDSIDCLKVELDDDPSVEPIVDGLVELYMNNNKQNRHSIKVGANTRILIHAEDDLAAGMQWRLSFDECDDRFAVNERHVNSKLAQELGYAGKIELVTFALKTHSNEKHMDDGETCMVIFKQYKTGDVTATTAIVNLTFI